MNDIRRQADELTAFLDAYASGESVAPPTPDAELAAELVELAASLRLPGDNGRFSPAAPPPLSATLQRESAELVARPRHRVTRSFSLPLVASLLLFFLVGGLLVRSIQLPALAPPVQDVLLRLPIPVGGHLRSLDPAALELMRAAGMEWVVFRQEYNPNAQERALESAAELIDGAHEQGFRIWLTLAPSLGTMLSEIDFPAFSAFAARVAALGADAVQVWETPNLTLVGGAGQLEPASYVDLLHQSYEAVKAAHPDTLVISAPPAPTSGQSSFSNQIINDDIYYQGMADAGAADVADCIGVSYYEGAVDPAALEGDLRGSYATRYFIPMLQRAASPFRAFDIPFCLSDYGYLVGEGRVLSSAFDWAQRTSPEDQAAWLAKGIKIAAELSSIRVAMVMIFRVDTVANSVEDGYAIIQPDGSCLACDAIAALRQ